MHWFCPRTTAGDDGVYFDEDVLDILSTESASEKATRLERVQEAEARRDLVLESCTILAFDGADATKYKVQVQEGLREQMTRCDICVREFYRSRDLLMQRLKARYDEEEVQAFIAKFDEMNATRICQGLNAATESLEDLPPDKRSIFAIGPASMHVFFEAMNCLPFLQSEDALQAYFDRPFRLVQANKKIRLPSYVPAMSCFLFSQNQERAAWAKRNFAQIKRPMTGTEFEHSIKPFLEPALNRVLIVALDRDFLPTFWSGTRAIISKLTKSLIRDHLRAMDHNVYREALEHFQIDDSHFEDLLFSFQILMKLSPYDFWEAMGHITAQAVTQAIFTSPTLDNLLRMTTEKEPLRLEEKLEFPITIINTVTPANLVPPVRAILNQLLVRFQQDQHSRYAQSVSWTQGLYCLLTALKIMREKLQAGPIITNMIQIVANDYAESIKQEIGSTNDKIENQLSKSQGLCLDIVEVAISLDLAGLARDRDAILRTKTLDHDLAVTNLDLWRMSTKQLKRANYLLATSILSGITGLLGIEDFTSDQIKKLQLKSAKSWNDSMQLVVDYVCNDLLDAVEQFDEDAFQNLFHEAKAIRGLTFLLFSGESRMHQSSLNILKRLANATGRRDSLMNLLTTSYRSAMPSVSQALDQISTSRAFGPCPMAIKINGDMLDCLCNTQDGLLRSRSLQAAEIELLQELWQKMWELLGMIFEQTEAWSAIGHDKKVLQEFCRETMEFADNAFEQYAIFASTLQGTSTKNGTEVRKMLLEHPRAKFTHITKWLRLRDEHLIASSVSLIVKILGRLQEVGLQVQTDAAQFIEDTYTVTSGEKRARVRTNLSMQQKAELQRALEKHIGSDRDGMDVNVLGKPKKQTSLQEWASSGRRSGASTPTSGISKPSRPGTINVDAGSDAAKRRKDNEAFYDRETQKLINSMPGAEAHKQRMLQQQQKRPSVGLATAKAAEKHQNDQKNFLAIRAKEKQEAEKRRKAALAKAQTLGAGSGVLGLGDLGKEHDVKTQGVMVSSDEESQDEDDGDDSLGLFGPPKKKVERPNFKSGENLGLPIEQKAGPTKIQRAQRSARDMRARLAPDLTPLHRAILRWDFFHTGDYPPGSDEEQFSQVSSAFNDPATYQQTFQPLLTLEAWQGMVKAREEGPFKPYEVKVQNRTNVDSFVEISSIIGHNEYRELQLQESDIILLSKAKKPADDPTAPHCLARIYKVKRQKAHCEVLYQLSPNTPLSPSLSGQAVVFAVKVQSITPLEREYGALQALQYYDLCTQIVKAKPSKKLQYTDKQVAVCQDVWNVNRAQGEAINSALDNDGFTLIQGPPGSGKTKTIVAIVGGLLAKALSSTTSGVKISVPGSRGGPTTGGGDAPTKKLLVCAPSNAAVDELVIRLKEGVKTKDGRHHQLNVVRIGRSEAINSQVLDVTMDELVAKRLGGNENDQKMRERNAELFKEHEKISAQLREMYALRDDGKVESKELATLEGEIASMRKRKNELGIRIDNAKDAERNAGRQADLNRKRAQQAVLDDAHVICATLSGSGHDMFQSLNIEFETVIIDEAAQCVEMSSLIPLKYGCVKCVLVGDPKQLPPTVFSKEAAKFQYEQSLFVRMQNNFEDEVHLLDTQYRMHPDISVFPSQTFYDGLLRDGKGMAGLRTRPWHASALLAPYRFFDVAGKHENAPRGHSLINLAEIDIAIALFDRLKTDFPSYDYKSNIGVITPYKSQLRALKDRFAARYGTTIFDEVEFNTTDAFQGRESEVIIFSCVRASPAGGIGFLQDIRRMNVGLTRAKCSLWVLGNSGSLIRGHFWRKLVEDAKARDCYSTGNLKAMLAGPSSAYPAMNSTDRSMLDVNSHVWQMSNNNDKRHTSATLASNDALSSNAGPYRSMMNLSEPTLDNGRMEGVSSRFQDRYGKKSTASSDTGSNGDVPHLQQEFSASAEAQDVEMGEADSAGRRSATPNLVASRAETPLSGDERSMNQANGAVKPRPGSVATSVTQPKKRPAPNPFLPRKQPKQRMP